ncbi:hypothetical protein AX14_004290 [Amanita brunnescens Koide BX004]|nr:hypothetical protein AX14_004290 [Amanita brunnescens Koide BX004]
MQRTRRHGNAVLPVSPWFTILMSSPLAAYSSLSPSSTRVDIHRVLQSIIDAPPSSVDRADREELLKLLLLDLSTCGPKSRLSAKDAAQALLALKTLGKDQSGSLYLSSVANLSSILSFSSTFRDDPDAVSEALRTIANTLLLIAEARTTFVGGGVAGGMLSAIMLEKATTPDQIFILSRILFLCTASGTSFVQILVEEKHHGRTMVDIIDAKLDLLTTAILSGTKLAREAMSDLLKFAFNLLHHYPKLIESEREAAHEKITGDFWGSRLDGMLPSLLRTFSQLPPTFPSPIAIPLTHVIHALIVIPVSPSLRQHWFNTSSPSRSGANPSPKSTSSPTSGSRSDSPTGTGSAVLSPKPSSPGSHIDIAQRGMDLLDVSFSHFFPGAVEADDPSVRERARKESPDNSLDDLMSPLVVLIARLCVADENTRIRIRQWIVPDDLDRSTPLEERSDVLGRCLRLLASVYHPRLKDSVGEMLYAMADSNATTLSALVGYGNVAGYLFNKGILHAPPPNTSTTNPSLTTSSGQAINPITGTTEKPKPDAPEMTEEEKEREMEKLFVLFDRLERTGNLPRDQNPIRKAIQEGKLPI